MDQDIENWFAEKAEAKGVPLQSLVIELLRKDISLSKKLLEKVKAIFSGL